MIFRCCKSSNCYLSGFNRDLLSLRIKTWILLAYLLVVQYITEYILISSYLHFFSKSCSLDTLDFLNCTATGCFSKTTYYLKHQWCNDWYFSFNMIIHGLFISWYGVFTSLSVTASIFISVLVYITVLCFLINTSIFFTLSFYLEPFISYLNESKTSR